MVALYVTSPYAGAGKTAVCAGLGRHLAGDGKRVGFFKPIVSGIKSAEAADSDAEFMKQVLALAEPIKSLCPLIGGDGDMTAKIKQAYAKVSKGKDVVIVEGVWRQRPGGKPAEASHQVAEALEGRVIVVEPYSKGLSAAGLINNYKGFGENLLGVVINRVPKSRLSAKFGNGEVNILGVFPEDRVLLSLTVMELAERIHGEILNSAERSTELVEDFMLGAMGVDSGLNYFGRKDNKAVVVRGERPDMQLAALETSTRCLVVNGGSPSQSVLQRARDKGVPIILAKGDIISTVSSIELALGKTRFNQKKLPRLIEIIEQQFNFKALYKELNLGN